MSECGINCDFAQWRSMCGTLAIRRAEGFAWMVWNKCSPTGRASAFLTFPSFCNVIMACGIYIPAILMLVPVCQFTAPTFAGWGVTYRQMRDWFRSLAVYISFARWTARYSVPPKNAINTSWCHTVFSCDGYGSRPGTIDILRLIASDNGFFLVISQFSRWLNNTTSLSGFCITSAITENTWCAWKRLKGFTTIQTVGKYFHSDILSQERSLRFL